MDNYLEYLANKSIGWYVTKASRVITRCYNEFLKEYGISGSQAGILIALYDAEQKHKSLTQQDLSAILFLHKVNTHNLLSRLEKKKIIKKIINIKNLRSKKVSLTKKGKTLITHIQKIDANITKELTDHLIRFIQEKNSKDIIISTQIFSEMLIHILKFSMKNEKQ